MPDTPNLALPYPDLQAPADVPADIKALAERLDQLLFDTAWTVPTLLSPWQNLGSGFETAAYLKDPLGFVHLKGVITGGASGSTAFTLPAGFRSSAITAHGAGNTGLNNALVEVNPGGAVIVFISTPSAVGLSGITFLAEN